MTKQSPAAMAAFTVVCFGVPYALGKGVMWVFNPREEGALEQQLRERATVHHKVLHRPAIFNTSTVPARDRSNVLCSSWLVVDRFATCRAVKRSEQKQKHCV